MFSGRRWIPLTSKLRHREPSRWIFFLGRSVLPGLYSLAWIVISRDGAAITDGQLIGSQQLTPLPREGGADRAANANIVKTTYLMFMSLCVMFLHSNVCIRMRICLFNPRPVRGGVDTTPNEFFWAGRHTVWRIVLKLSIAYGASFAQLLVEKNGQVRAVFTGSAHGADGWQPSGHIRHRRQSHFEHTGSQQLSAKPADQTHSKMAPMGTNPGEQLLTYNISK